MSEKEYDFTMFDLEELTTAEIWISRQIVGQLGEGRHPNGPSLGPLTKRRNEIRKAIALKKVNASA